MIYVLCNRVKCEANAVGHVVGRSLFVSLFVRLVIRLGDGGGWRREGACIMNGSGFGVA